LARYAGRLGFGIEQATRQLAEVAVTVRAPDTVSGPRLGTELRLLAEQGDPVPGFLILAELGIDAAIAPTLGIRSRGRADLARRARALLPPDAEHADLVLAVAALDVPTPDLAALLDRLAFPAARRQRIVATATRARELARRLGEAERPSQIAAAVGSGPPELVALAAALGAALGVEGAEAAGRLWLGELRRVRLEIDGDDLI